jgi:hypothetical protein
MYELYDKLFDIDDEAISAPEYFYTTLSDATKAARDRDNAKLDALHTFYLFEFYKIVKIGGIKNHCACIEWPGIQISWAILICGQTPILESHCRYKNNPTAAARGPGEGSRGPTASMW